MFLTNQSRKVFLFHISPFILPQKNDTLNTKHFNCVNYLK